MLSATGPYTLRTPAPSLLKTRHRLLALSCLCPGASTLVANLLRRAAVSPVEARRRTAGGRRWLRAYLNGCAHKVHIARLGPSLACVAFADAAAWLFRTSGCVLVGTMRGGKPILNPGRRLLRGGETAVVVGTSAAAVEAALARPYAPSVAAPAEARRPPPPPTAGNTSPVPECRLPGDGDLESDSYDLDGDECDVSLLLKQPKVVAGGGGDGAGAASDASATSPPATAPPASTPPMGTTSFSSLDDGNDSDDDAAASLDAHQGGWQAQGANAAPPPAPPPPPQPAPACPVGHAGFVDDGVYFEAEAPRPARATPAAAAVLINGEPLDGHVIVCGSPASHVSFVEQLRRCDPLPTPVVILAPQKPDPEAWAALQALGPVHHVPGEPNTAAGLRSARAASARALIFLALPQRPASPEDAAPLLAASAPADKAAASRTAVLADAQGLLTCYGVGEEGGTSLPHAVVELCFTSSLRFLQPGLLLKGTTSGGGTSRPGEPRKSWQARKRQEAAATREGIAQWQSNPYYCAGRVTVGGGGGWGWGERWVQQWSWQAAPAQPA